MKNLFAIIAAALIAGAAFWVRSRALRQGINDEYRGWRKYKVVTGRWPVWSVVTSVLSIPLAFAFGLACWMAGFRAGGQGHLLPIYFGLFVGVTGGVLLWFILRTVARKADLMRAYGKSKLGTRTLDGFLR